MKRSRWRNVRTVKLSVRHFPEALAGKIAATSVLLGGRQVTREMVLALAADRGLAAWHAGATRMNQDEAVKRFLCEFDAAFGETRSNTMGGENEETVQTGSGQSPAGGEAEGG